MFIVTVTYTAPIEQVNALRAAHREWLDIHMASGVLLVTGPQVPMVGGVLIASGKLDRASLAALLTNDPFSINGVADYAITEFEPNKVNPALVGLV